MSVATTEEEKMLERKFMEKGLHEGYFYDVKRKFLDEDVWEKRDTSNTASSSDVTISNLHSGSYKGSLRDSLNGALITPDNKTAYQPQQRYESEDVNENVGCCRCACAARTDCIQRPLSDLFFKYGKLIARHPVPFIVVPIILSLLGGVCFLRIQKEGDFEYLFTPTNGKGKVERSILKEYFPMDTSRHWPNRSPSVKGFATVIIVSKNGKSLFDRDNFRSVLHVDDSVTNYSVQDELGGKVSAYKDMCKKWQGICLPNPTVELFFRDPEIAHNTKIHYPTHEGVFLGSVFGGVTLNKTSGIAQNVQAVRLFYYLKYNSTNDTQIADKWLRVFLRNLRAYHSDNIALYPDTYNALTEEINKISEGVLPKFCITYLFVILFSVLTCMTRDWVRSKPLLAFIGVVTAGMAVISAFGLLCLFGVPTISIVGVTPFLALGVGVDAMFIIIASWRQSSVYKSVEDRMALAMKESTTSITITSMTNFLAFCVGSVTVFPSVQIFCWYTGTCILFCYIYCVTFFAGCTVLSGRREEANRHSIVPCIQVDPIEEKDTHSGCYTAFCAGGIRRKLSEDGLSHVPDLDKYPQGHSGVYDTAAMRFFRDKFAPTIMTKVAKALVLVIYACYLAISLWGITQLREGLQMRGLVRTNSPYLGYYEAESSYFNKYGLQVNVIIKQQLNFTNYKAVHQLEKLVRQFEESKYVIQGQGNEMWWRDYDTFLTKMMVKHKVKSEDMYVTLLRDQFLQIGGLDKYGLDVKFSNSSEHPRIISTRFLMQARFLKDIKEEREMMNDFRRIAANSELNVTVFCPKYVFFDLYDEILPSTMQTMGIGIAVMIVIALALLPNPLCSFWVIMAIISIELGVVGLMTLWGVNLDGCSMISLILCIGFSVDYSAHISYAFISSERNSARERAKDALYTLGTPIAQGSLSTILGILILSTSVSYVFTTFFKCTFLVIVLGMLHGLFVLPVVLSLLGVSRDCIRGTEKDAMLTVENGKHLPDSASSLTRSDVTTCPSGVTEIVYLDGKVSTV